MTTQSVRINKAPKTRTYYNREGEPLPGLPADAYHMERYLGRGFTLNPPVYVSEADKEASATAFDDAVAARVEIELKILAEAREAEQATKDE